MEDFRLLAACFIACALAGCAAPPPRADVPVAAPPLQWQTPLPHNGNLTDLSQWWQGLGDPLLVRLVEAAQGASPSVASALSRVAQSRAATVQAAAALLPTLDASASAVRGSTQVAMPVATTVQAALQASWEADLFGANRRAGEAAQARLESAQAQWHDARVAVAAEVAHRYFGQRACEQQAAITRLDADSQSRSARLQALSSQAGFTAPAAAALARASAAEASSRATQQRALCALDTLALAALTGWPVTELQPKLAAAPLDLAPAAAITITSVPARALGQRPDLFSAQREVAAAAADAGAAEAQRYPRLGLSGSIGATRYRAGAASDNFASWSIGPVTFSVPLFDGGRQAASMQAAQARYEEAVFLYQARTRQAVREVEEALVNLQSTAARSDDASQADQGYRAWLRATEARFEGGLANQMELEETRRTALAAANALVALRRERIQAWIALYRAVGGGWEQPPATGP